MRHSAFAQTHCGGELGGNLLGLVADVELWHLSAFLIIRRQHAGQHSDEGGLACTIFAQHDQDLTVCEGAFLYIQLK